MGLEVDGSHTKDVHAFPHNFTGNESTQDLDIDGKEKHGIKDKSIESKDGKEKVEFSVEEVFASSAVPPWWAQITIRGIVVSLFLGFLFSVITLKLSLTTGVIPSLNISAGLLGFFFVKLYTTILGKLRISHKPFTRQENTVIQTCVVACYGLAFSGNEFHTLLS